MLSTESGSAFEGGKPQAEDLRAMGSVLKPDALRVLGSVLSLLPACALAHGGPGLVTVGPGPDASPAAGPESSKSASPQSLHPPERV